jgi:hypothetical protein
LPASHGFVAAAQTCPPTPGHPPGQRPASTNRALGGTRPISRDIVFFRAPFESLQFSPLRMATHHRMSWLWAASIGTKWNAYGVVWTLYMMWRLEIGLEKIRTDNNPLILMKDYVNRKIHFHFKPLP